MQQLLAWIQALNLSGHKGDASPFTKLSQIDGQVVVLHQPCNQAGHHAGIQGSAASVDQHNHAIWPQLGLHGPAF